MKIYTKTGDDGTTGLFGGEFIRVKKYDLRVETYGTCDELNSHIGLINNDNSSIKENLIIIQKKLFNISSTIAMDDSDISMKQKKDLHIKDEDIYFLENLIDIMNEELPTLKSFILPIGTQNAVYAHVCRTICRRFERRLIELNDNNGNIDKNILIFINRLSDYFFMLARYYNHLSGYTESLWK